MSPWLLAAAMAAAVNPFRSRVGLGAKPLAVPAVATGVAVSTGVVTLLAAASASLLAALQITPETFLLAAGLVAIIAGARTMFVPRPVEEPALPGWRQGLWPLAFPRILSPEVIALSLGLVAPGGAAPVVAAAVGGVIALAMLSRVGLTEHTTGLLTALGTVLGMVLVVVGIWMMIEGIRDV